MTSLPSRLPTIEDLKRLPLRSLAAYAARCALRSRPMYLIAHELAAAEAGRAEAALAATTEFVEGRGGSGPLCDAALAAHAAANGKPAHLRGALKTIAYAADAAAKAAFAHYAAEAARYSADAAGFAGDIDFVLQPKLNADLIAQDVAYSAANAAISSCVIGCEQALKSAANCDYRALRGLHVGDYPSLGERILLGAPGPLGGVWPAPAAPWLARANECGAAGHQAALAVWCAARMGESKEAHLNERLCRVFELTHEQMSRGLSLLERASLLALLDHTATSWSVVIK